jgi:hypothetical protein
VNNASTNNYQFENLLSILWVFTRSGVAESLANLIFNLFKVLHPVYHNGFIIFTFPPTVHRGLISPHIHQHLLFSVVLIVAILVSVMWSLVWFSFTFP